MTSLNRACTRPQRSSLTIRSLGCSSLHHLSRDSALAPRAAWRTHVVRRDAWLDGTPPPASEIDVPPAPPADASRGSGRGQLWAELMRRSFGLDVLACPRCGGRLRLIALIEEASVIERILRHLGLPTEIPAAHPARAPPRSIERGSRCPRREIEFDPRG